MKIITNLDQINIKIKDSIVTIGNFDGVHKAHQTIISRIVYEANKNHKNSVIITFNPHPQEFFHSSKKSFFLITTLQEKLTIFNQLGVNYVLVLKFSRNFAKLSAFDFIKNIVYKNFQPQKIFIGYDNTFGKKKIGNYLYLKKLGHIFGFSVEKINPIFFENFKISSTLIRKLIKQGNIGFVLKLLNRPYSIKGIVIKGSQIGRVLGFHTANVKPPQKILPCNGVYITSTKINNRIYNSITNIGHNPTFKKCNTLSIETHILNMCENIYGKLIEIFFLKRLRNEKKFKCIIKFKKQIMNDIKKTKFFFSKKY